MNTKFEYPDFFARFYDIIYKKIRTEDNDYFLKKITENNKGNTLEIGVGTGRFFTEALKAGANIYGIDISKSMTDILRKKLGTEHHHRVFTGDAVSMRFDKKFDLILAPFRVLSHITDTNSQLALLNNIYDHLNENGTFIFDLFVPNPELLHKGINNVIDFEGEYEPGKKLRRTSTSIPDIVNQLLSVTMKFEWDENGQSMEKLWDFQMRFYFRYEIEHLVKLSKLKLSAIYGDYNEGILKKDSKEFIVICKK
jgi:SAM-dependent methyltransferase